MDDDMLKVGELARRTGVSVRTLHHYHRIGLLEPAARTASGHRLYGNDDLARLQAIGSLRQLGFSLEQVRQCLDGGDYPLDRVLGLHVVRLRQQIEVQERLCRRLEGLAQRLARGQSPTGDDLMQAIEETHWIERHYTPDQLETLAQRAREIGQERIDEAQEEWPRLIEAVRQARDAGKDPSSPEVRELARRWRGLVAEFTGGDPGIARSLANLYQQEPGARQRWGVDPALGEYLGLGSEGAVDPRSAGQ